jgi:hypothetical protein
MLRLVHVLLLEQAAVRTFEHFPAIAGAQEMAQLSAEDRADRRADQQHRQRQAHADDLGRGRRCGDAGQEQQGIARKEEADQEAGLDEHDHPDAVDAERLEQLLGVERVDGKRLGECTGHGAQGIG